MKSGKAIYRTLGGRLAMVLSVLLGGLSACSTAPETVASASPVGEWSLQRWVLNGEQKPLDTSIGSPTLLIHSSGSISGFSGVNRYNGEAEFDASGKLTVSPRIMTTRRAGPPAAMQQEQSYLSFLPAVTSYQQSGDMLRLENNQSWAEFSKSGE